jgi:hypothetical protein
MKNNARIGVSINTGYFVMCSAVCEGIEDTTGTTHSTSFSGLNLSIRQNILFFKLKGTTDAWAWILASLLPRDSTSYGRLFQYNYRRSR